MDVISPTDNGLYKLMTQGAGRLLRRQLVVDGVVEKSRKVGDQFYEVSAQVEAGFFKDRVTKVTIRKSNFDDEIPSLEINMRGDGGLSLSFTDSFQRKSDFSKTDLAKARIEGRRNVIETDNVANLAHPTVDAISQEARRAFFGI